MLYINYIYCIYYSSLHQGQADFEPADVEGRPVELAFFDAGHLVEPLGPNSGRGRPGAAKDVRRSTLKWWISWEFMGFYADFMGFFLDFIGFFGIL